MDPVEKEDIEWARSLMDPMNSGDRDLALLSTVSPDGQPHATWMGAWKPADTLEVLTISSPDSEKVRNIRENCRVEWLFGGTSLKGLLYLIGTAEIVEEVAEIKRCWNSIPRKEEVFFMRYYNSGIGFSIIRTRIDSAVMVYPEQCRKVAIRLEDLSEDA